MRNFAEHDLSEMKVEHNKKIIKFKLLFFKKCILYIFIFPLK